ncbi:PREDICTED: olfactory receptor 5V1-like [Nanorana parkeri]|uniref:olfactory receptor 5V1-like n=1 Tax=Nanorana parkeri TaxID=125878 RepID=UPI000854B204|nr:PREDICTED: olfactory receptor 5V1-like [Nanorana parkeri]
MALYVMLENSNQTVVRKFILLGLSSINSLQVVFSLLLFLMYMVTSLGNLLLIIIVKLNPRLQTPMYFFLTNLATIDICYSTTVVPKILASTLSQDRSISFLGCAIQLYFHASLAAAECLILTIMAFDRYNAICKPLQYHMIMDQKLCFRLAVACWAVSFAVPVHLTLYTFGLPFCKSNRIEHFFCEMPPLLNLACADIWFNEILAYIAAIVVVGGTFVLILVSYLFITLTILKIDSTKQKQKAFSTCASHLLVVFLFYVTVLFMHLRPPSSYSPQQDRVVSIFYTVVTPMLNPIIYSVRNKEIKVAIRKTLAVAVCQ